ncbi:DUF6088 family protein [Bacteroides luti]|nr:DUF6088 family protein [Bacteroides luti]
MKLVKNTLTGKIMSRISESEPGSLFFISDFSEFNNDEVVGKILSQLEKLGKISRLSNGIYFKPIQSRFGVIYPDTETIVNAIAKRDQAQIMPTGSTAMNLLGLSTQVPMNAVYITTGSSRTINIGKRKITFRRSVPKNFAYKGKIMSLLVQALKSIGEENVTNEHMYTIRDLLMNNQEESTIKNDLQLAPLWIKKLLSQIINEQIHE